MKIKLKERFNQVFVYGVSVIALSSVAGISIAQANHDSYQPLSVKNHTGTASTNPTPPVTKAAAKQDISKDHQKIKNDEKQLTKAKTAKERKLIETKIKQDKHDLKQNKKALTKLTKEKLKAKDKVKAKSSNHTKKK